ncbi:MAG: DUF262 domain-containing protein [Bryobacteraceae bacterium]
MPQIPSRFVDIVQQLTENKQPRRATVRSVLKWFNAARRGANVVVEIGEALKLAGLETEPPFAQAGIDEPIRFVLRSPTKGPLPNASTAPPGQAEQPPSTLAPQDDGTKPSMNGNDTTPDLTSPDFLEPELDEVQSPTKVDDRPVSSQPHDWTLSTLRDKLDRGQLELQPPYQREYVWKLRPELPSRLIESLLLEIPIPPIYFGKITSGRLEVIDGQQRLTTMINFISNKFQLQRLQRMGSLNGKSFKELSDEHQTKILDAPIRSVVIDAGSNTDLRYEVFERLNRGSMALNEQELRNCVYRGPFNDLVGELECDPYWRKIRGTTVPEPRFIEREIILRFFAFVNRLQFYAGNLKRFLNEYMASYAPRDADQIKIQANVFRQTVQNIYTVFGPNSARLYNIDLKSNKGAWDTKFSVAALDIQVAALVGKSPSKVQAAAEQIREQYLYCLLSDAVLQSAISKQTAGTIQTKYRWIAFKTVAEPIIDGTILEPRFFDITFRRRLFDESPVCKICGNQICGNQIHSFDDSTVDHVHPHSKGGKTVPENGQVAHRSCNARKNTFLPSDSTAAKSISRVV